MRQYNIERAERNTRTKAILATLLVHFGLLYGLFYMNSDQPSDLMPEFVKEWVKGEETQKVVASHGKRP